MIFLVSVRHLGVGFGSRVEHVVDGPGRHTRDREESEVGLIAK